MDLFKKFSNFPCTRARRGRRMRRSRMCFPVFPVSSGHARDAPGEVSAGRQPSLTNAFEVLEWA